MGQTENYDKYIEEKDIIPKKEIKKKEEKENMKKTKQTKKNKESGKNINIDIFRNRSENLTMQQKLSIPIHDENDSEKVDKEKIIRLKMGLNDDFKIRNMFDYNINLITVFIQIKQPIELLE